MPPAPGASPGRRGPRSEPPRGPRRAAHAGSTSARGARCCGRVPYSHRSGRTAAARRSPPGAEFSPSDLHTALLRPIDELGGILPQAGRECAGVLGRLAPLTRKALELRQPVARERAHVLAVLRDQPVELLAGARQMVGNEV